MIDKVVALAGGHPWAVGSLMAAACFPGGALTQEPAVSSVEHAVGQIASIKTPYVKLLEQHIHIERSKDAQLAKFYWAMDATRRSGDDYDDDMPSSQRELVVSLGVGKANVAGHHFANAVVEAQLDRAAFPITMTDDRRKQVLSRCFHKGQEPAWRDLLTEAIQGDIYPNWTGIVSGLHHENHNRYFIRGIETAMERLCGLQDSLSVESCRM